MTAPSTANTWLRPPERFTLGVDEVHVWRAALGHPPPSVSQMEALLSAEERARAGRFRFDRDRQRFVAAHGALRDILGRYLDIEPNHVRFRYDEWGKPSVAAGYDGEPIRFNMSHSRALALYAVSRRRAIGVDVEWIDRELPDDEGAARFFSVGEIAALRGLPSSLQREAFFTCWTRKEAYLKARGLGLSLPLDQFDVSLAPGEPPALLNTRWDPAEASRWSLCAIAVAPDYAATLAVEGRGWRLHCWEWRGVRREPLS